MPRVLPGQAHGARRDVDAVDVKPGDGGAQEGVQEEGDAAGAGAEVQDAEGWWWW